MTESEAPVILKGVKIIEEGIEKIATFGEVRYSESQSLGDTQKAQARQNIGAVGSINEQTPDENGNVQIEAVLYTEQTLDNDQKARARANIGAVTLDEVLEALPIYNGEVEDV